MPILARVYNVPPGDQKRLTLAEFRELRRDYQQLQQQLQQ
jgi:hypothetical protein